MATPRRARHHAALERQAEAWFSGEYAEDPVESYSEYADPSYLCDFLPLPAAAIPPAPGDLIDVEIFLLFDQLFARDFEAWPRRESVFRVLVAHDIT